MENGLRITKINIFDSKSIYRLFSLLTDDRVIQELLNFTEEGIRAFIFLKIETFFILLSTD